jgi:short-subunit dehydrogenase
MRARSSGLVVFVSSIIGRYVVPYIGVYAASKWALEALAESMSYELRASGVDIAIVEPGILRRTS